MNSASQRKKYSYYVQYKYTISNQQETETTKTPVFGLEVDRHDPNQTQTQDKINNATEEVDNSAPVETEEQQPSAIESDTPYVQITDQGISSENLEEDAITYDMESVPKVITVKKAGTYALSGGTTDNPITNTQIVVAKGITDEVNLIWDNQAGLSVVDVMPVTTDYEKIKARKYIRNNFLFLKYMV